MRTLLLRTLLVLVVASGALAVVLFARTALMDVPPLPEVEPHPFVVDEDGALERLAGALRIPTVAAVDPESETGVVDADAILRLHEHLRAGFPLVHDRLERETVSGLALLYRWEGSDPDLSPILFTAHMDVVGPEAGGALDGPASDWTHPPFSGAIAGGYAWGRGALDMKGPLLAILEAVEGLLAEGFEPRRTLLLAFGHDEELGGGEGARRIAELLEERGVRPEWVLDEGGALATGVLRGMNDPLGLVGTGEKGYLTVEISKRGEMGHSGLPELETTAGGVSRAVARLEEDPFPPRLEGPGRELLLTVAPHLDPGTRMLAANLWLLEAPLARALANDPITQTMVRTTTAPTVLRAGERENVLPAEATALVNFRIAPWDSVESVLERVRERVQDLDVEVRVRDEEVGAFPPSSVSSTQARGYRILRESIHATFPDVRAVAPYLVFAATDGRHYADVARDVYRFAPFRVTPETLERVHGVDERIRAEEYFGMIRFYAELIRRGA